jgi:hypothetical protein
MVQMCRIPDTYYLRFRPKSGDDDNDIRYRHSVLIAVFFPTTPQNKFPEPPPPPHHKPPAAAPVKSVVGGRYSFALLYICSFI